jgi:cobaltochelatase CobS
MDELDAADDNTLLVINSSLSNGRLALPNRLHKPWAKMHPNFVALAAANTFGTGADRMYVARNQLDEASLDRFRIGQILMDYDLEIEAHLCPDHDLRGRLQGYRTRAKGIRRIISTRFMRDAWIMKSQAGWTDHDIDTALFSGWGADEIAKVRS